MALDTERFEVLREVGRGGFGVVFQARDRVDDSVVAIKVLHVSDDVADARFDREALLLSRLRHPSIVRYIAHGRTPAGRFLVMEWLEGCTLQHLLQTVTPSVRDVVVLARRMLEALVEAGRYGVVHRDIKPANVFLVANQMSRAKLLDFGIARQVDDSHSLARTGRPLGTPRTATIEQALSPFHVRTMHLAEGSRVLILDSELAASDQVVAAARSALALRRLLPEAAITVCTGRAVVGSKRPFGEIFDRGAALLEATSAGVVQLDEASAALLDSRFEIKRLPGTALLGQERRDDETPRTLLGRTTPFIGRERELAQLH